jgi:hypothetical protein
MENVCDAKQTEGGVCRFLIPPTDGKDASLCRRRGEFICRETLDRNLPNLSHTARESWVRCKQKYYLEKVRGLKAKVDKISTPLKFGTMWDKFQENNYGRSHDLSRLANILDLSELEVARFNAICSSFKKLQLARRTDELYDLQTKIVIPGRNCNIVGYLDRSYEDHFVEIKMSAKPQYYQDPFNIAFQVGTYFLANPRWQYVIMEVTRTPTLTWERDHETIEEYEVRLHKDIIKRAPMYFPGINRKQCTYGKKFYRSEFPLDEIKKTYEYVESEILGASRDCSGVLFYKSFQCTTPFPCDFLPICRDGVISKTLFTTRSKPEEDIEEVIDEQD